MGGGLADRVAASAVEVERELGTDVRLGELGQPMMDVGQSAARGRLDAS